MFFCSNILEKKGLHLCATCHAAKSSHVLQSRFITLVMEARLSGRTGRPRLSSMKLPSVSLNHDAKLPVCIRWYAKTHLKRAHVESTLRGSNDARSERERQTAQRRAPISAVQRSIKRRLLKLRKLALKDAVVDKKRLYLALWQATPNKHGGRIGSRWRTKGLAVLQFDKSEPALNITNSIVISTLRLWMQRGLVAALFESPTCASWSIASKRPSLRSCTQPWGLPNLPSKAQNKIEVGNQEGRIALGFLRHCHKFNVPAALEHPASSYLLKTDEFFHIVKTCNTKLADFHQCCFGAKWWKPTTLVSIGKEPTNHWVCWFGKQCQRKHNKCDFSGMPHVSITGNVSAKTSIYPFAMSDKIADELAAQAAV